MPETRMVLANPGFDDGVGAGVRRIGLMALSGDQVGERAFGRIVEAAGAAYFTTRLAYTPDATDEQDEADLRAASQRLLPEAGIDLLAYSCTSRTAERGEEATIRMLRAARPGVPVSTPLTAALEALRALSARRLAFLSPYKARIHKAMLAAAEAGGMEIVRSACFDLPGDFPRLTTAAIEEQARLLAGSDVDALFISCTGIRSTEAIVPLEAATGLPVVTSSQALAWHSLRLLGIAVSSETGPGRLFTDSAPTTRN